MYNKIELVGSWEILQRIRSETRKNPDALTDCMIKHAVDKIYKHILDAMIMYMETDKLSDDYMYRYEIQVTRQKQEHNK